MSSAHKKHSHNKEKGDSHPESDSTAGDNLLSKEQNSLSTNGEQHENAQKQVTIPINQLEELKKELAETKDKYLRVLAESENARKRLQKEKQEMIEYALQNVIVDFLTPIDHMENALSFAQQMSDDVKHWAIGFQMILSQFKDVLTNNGVSPFESEGKPFDPHNHEAIETVESSEFPPNTIIKENLRGYLMGKKTIRPARVVVSKPPFNEKLVHEEKD